MSSLTDLIADITAEYPKFKLRPKGSSYFMRAIDCLLWFITFGRMKSFMSSFTTTIGYTVYTPTAWGDWSERSRVAILRHERVHMRQRKEKGAFWFSASYLLLPFPVLWAYYRMKYEMEAYEESMRVLWEYKGAEAFDDTRRAAMIGHFTSAEYFWMWPWRKRIERWYDGVVKRIVAV